MRHRELPAPPGEVKQHKGLIVFALQMEEDAADAAAAAEDGDAGGGSGDNGMKLTGSKLFSVFELQGEKQKKKSNKKQRKS